MLAPGPKTLEIGDVQSTLTAGRLVATLATALQDGLDVLGIAHPRDGFHLSPSRSEKTGYGQEGNTQKGNQKSHFTRSAIIGCGSREGQETWGQERENEEREKSEDGRLGYA